MTKDRKKEKKEMKEKKERKEKKRREAEELAVKEKKISKKLKSESKKSEKPKKKPKKSDVEEEKPQKKSKESKKKQKQSDESEEPQTQIVRPDDVIAAVNNATDSDFELDKEDVKHLLESYTKEELVNLIYKTAEKGSRLIAAVLESADRDSAKRNIFVRGLGWDTTQENLKAAFEVYGEIEECSVVMDKDTGKAKGYGFVMFRTRKGAREALRNPEKRMYNRTVSCNLAAAKPSGAGKPREPVETVKIDLTRTANQSEMALPGLELSHGHVNGLDNGNQHQAMPMYAGQNMPFYGQPPGFNPMYGALMANHMAAGLSNYRMFGPGPGMMNPGTMMPPNHVGMPGQYSGDGNNVGPGFEGERAWYLR